MVQNLVVSFAWLIFITTEVLLQQVQILEGSMGSGELNIMSIGSLSSLPNMRLKALWSGECWFDRPDHG